MGTIFTMESANLYAGAQPADTTNSLHLTLTELKLPGFDLQFADHRPGGSMVSIEIDTVFARLESTFILLGWDPQVAGLIAQWSAQGQLFTALGNIRDRNGGGSMQAIAKMWGKLARSDPQNWRKGEPQHWNYSIRGITHYELTMGPEQIYYFDFYTNTFLVRGQSVMSDTNQHLLIPNAAVPIIGANPANFAQP